MTRAHPQATCRAEPNNGGRRPRWRLGCMAFVACAAALDLAACGPIHTSHPGAGVIRTNLSFAVLNAVDGWGMPVNFDHVGCHGPGTGHVVTCYAATTDEPEGAIKAAFTIHRVGNRCPGPLVVRMSGVVLARVSADPCRR